MSVSTIEKRTGPDFNALGLDAVSEIGTRRRVEWGTEERQSGPHAENAVNARNRELRFMRCALRRNTRTCHDEARY